jgi:predicted DNA-binding transcriptional regulator AlpA
VLTGIPWSTDCQDAVWTVGHPLVVAHTDTRTHSKDTRKRPAHPRKRPALTIPNDPDAWLGTPEIGQLYGPARKTIYRWQRDGRFPPPDLILPGGRKVWFRRTLTAWQHAEAQR